MDPPKRLLAVSCQQRIVLSRRLGTAIHDSHGLAHFQEATNAGQKSIAAANVGEQEMEAAYSFCQLPHLQY